MALEQHFREENEKELKMQQYLKGTKNKVSCIFAYNFGRESLILLNFKIFSSW